jgi:glycosyltransferase involved in cell wall biosynthesis
MSKVSVVLCAHDEAATIRGAIGSVRAQTLDSDQIELIVVDDGSTDGTATIVERCTLDVGFQTTIICNEENQGLVRSANRGLHEAKAEYIIRLDADDAFAPSALERLVECAKSYRADLVFSDRYELDLRTNEVEYVPVSYADLFSMVAAGTLMLRDRLSEIGGYKEVFWEEYDLYLRYMADNRKSIHIPRPLMVYVQHQSSMTANEDRVREGWRELTELWGLDSLKKHGILPHFVENDDQLNDGNR